MANSSPPPRETPCNQATIGLDESSMAAMTSGSKGGWGVSPNSLISAPAEKQRPPDCNSIHSTSGSAKAVSSVCISPDRTAWPKALTGGLNRVIRLQEPLRLNVTGLLMARSPKDCRGDHHWPGCVSSLDRPKIKDNMLT